DLLPGAAAWLRPAGHPSPADGAVHEQDVRRLLRVAVGELLEQAKLAVGVRHPQRDEDDLAASGRLAFGVQRRDLFQRLPGSLLVRLRRLVHAAAVEATVFSLVPVLGGHFGERLEAGGFLLLPGLVGPGAGNQQDEQTTGKGKVWDTSSRC